MTTTDLAGMTLLDMSR